MSVFSRGSEPIQESNAGGMFWRPDAKAPINRAFILAPSLDNILVAPKYGVFEVSGGPCNASWIDIGASDVGNILGIKPSVKAFVWVLVPNDLKDKSKGYSAKMWECSKTHFTTIVTQIQEFGSDLQGLMVVLKKDGNRWSISANNAPKAHAVDGEVLEAEWKAISDKGLDGISDDSQEAVGKLVGLIPTQELQKKFLIERIQKKNPKVVNWAGVLRAFGLAAPEVEEESDVDEF